MKCYTNTYIFTTGRASKPSVKTVEYLTKQESWDALKAWTHKAEITETKLYVSVIDPSGREVYEGYVLFGHKAGFKKGA